MSESAICHSDAESTLAVENPHLILTVASARNGGGRNGFLNSAQFGRRKSHVNRAE